MLCWFLPYNNANQCPPLEPPTLLGCHRAPGGAPFPLSVYLTYANVYVSVLLSQEAKVRTGHGTTDWFQIGHGVRQGCTSSPCLFNLYAEYIMRNAGLEETQAGIKIAGRKSQICR